MRIKKTSVFILISLVCLAILAINLKVASSFLITPARIKDIVSSSLGVKSEMGGVTFDIWRGVQISDIRLFAPPPAGAETSFLAVKNAEIIADRSELLRGNFVVGKIILKQPELTWEPDVVAHYIKNLSTNAANSSDGTPDRKPTLAQVFPEGNQPQIVIKNGLIRVLQKELVQPNASVVLKDIDIFLHPISSQRYLIEGKTELEISSAAGRPFASACKITGELNGSAHLVQIKFSLADVNIDETLVSKLCDKYQEMWRAYQFAGPVNLDINYSYDFLSYTPDFSVHVDCLGNDITYGHFPYPLSGVRGQIVFSKLGVLLKKLSAVVPSTGSSYFLDGVVPGYGQGAGFEIALNAANLPLDNKLQNALPASLKNIWNQLAIGKGAVSFTSLIRRAPGINKNAEYDFQLSFKNTAFAPAYFPYPVSETDADIEVRIKTDSSTGVKIKSLTASRQVSGGLDLKSKIHLSGSLNVAGKETLFQLAIDAKNIQVNDYALKEAAKQYIADAENLWMAYQPEGVVNAVVLLSKTDEKKGVNVQLSVECNNNSLKLGPSYYPLTSLQGEIEYVSSITTNKSASDYIDNMLTALNAGGNSLSSGPIADRHLNQHSAPAVFFKHIKASNDKAVFDFDGMILDPFAKPVSALLVKASRLNFNNQLFELFPEQIKTFLKDTEFNGSGNLSLKVISSGLNFSAIDYYMEIKLSDGQLKTGVVLNEINGSIVLRGQYQGGTKKGNTAGAIQLNNLRLAGKQISNVSAQFLREDNRFNFYDINGLSYDGAISGYLVVLLPGSTPGEKYNYYGKLNIVGLDLKSAGRESTLISSNLSGKLSLEVLIKGHGSNVEDIILEGKASVVDAQLWEVPLFLSILNLFALPEKSVFHEGEMRFQFRKSRLNVGRLILASKSITLKGKGTIELDGALDLQVDTEFAPWFLPNIKLLKTFTQLVKSGIYTIKIGGTFTKPKSSLEPLPILDIFK